MSNVLIVYGSTTGNTADIAEYLGGRLRAAGHVADVRDAADVSPDGLCEGRDVALFGCSAWGTDEVELQTDFEPLFEAFDRIGVKGVKTACFASGDSSFEHFCGAVVLLQGFWQLKDNHEMIKINSLSEIKKVVGRKVHL